MAVHEYVGRRYRRGPRPTLECSFITHMLLSLTTWVVGLLRTLVFIFMDKFVVYIFEYIERFYRDVSPKKYNKIKRETPLILNLSNLY
jgi:hypothetical protein